MLKMLMQFFSQLLIFEDIIFNEQITYLHALVKLNERERAKFCVWRGEDCREKMGKKKEREVKEAELVSVCPGYFASK